MGFLSLTGIELSRFARSKFTVAAVFIVAILPTIYASLYLTANWDTTGNIGNLRAAVVNHDAGAVMTDLNDEETSIALGSELVETLTSSDDAGFTWFAVTDEEAALSDLGLGEYATVIVIPQDFSTNVASSTSTSPVQASLDVYTDDASNYLIGQITSSVTSIIRNELGVTITSEYLDNVFIGFTTIHDGMTAAADGATQLADGITQVEDGADALAEGISELNNGANDLAAGLGTLHNGTVSLQDGLAELENATSTLPDSAQALADGATSAHSGAQTLSSGLDTLEGGATSLAEGANQFAQGLDGLRQLAAAHPDWTIAQLDAALTSQGTSLAGLAGIGHTLADGASSLSNGTAQAASGAADLASGLDRLSTGLSSLAESAPALSQGIASAHDGASQIADGAKAASSGSSQLASGTGQLLDGGTALSDALSELSEGSGTLADELLSGAEAVPSYTTAESEALAAVVADPVDAAHTTLHAVETFGRGIAPFFISLTLWIGGIALYFVFRPVSPRALASTARTSRIALSGLSTGLLAGLLQAGIIVLLLHILGVTGPNLAATAGFIALTGLVFTAIHHLLTASLGTPGRFLALVLLILQLTSAGGTYPVEVAPKFFQAIAPYLPMTYTVDAIRRLLAEGWTNTVTHDALIVAAFGLAAILLTFAATKALRTWNIGRLHPSLHA